jgi:hypothetical protein
LYGLAIANKQNVEITPPKIVIPVITIAIIPYVVSSFLPAASVATKDKDTFSTCTTPHCANIPKRM